MCFRGFWIFFFFSLLSYNYVCFIATVTFCSYSSHSSIIIKLGFNCDCLSARLSVFHSEWDSSIFLDSSKQKIKELIATVGCRSLFADSCVQYILDFNVLVQLYRKRYTRNMNILYLFVSLCHGFDSISIVPPLEIKLFADNNSR